MLVYSMMNAEQAKMMWEMTQDEVMIMLVNKVNPFRRGVTKNSYSEKLNKIVERMLELNHQNRLDSSRFDLSVVQLLQLVQNHPIFKEINQEFDGIFMREVVGRVKKPLNELLRLTSFEELLNINHLLSAYFGGITDGKGELTVDMATISHKLQVSLGQQFKTPVDFKRLETVSTVRDDSTEGDDTLREEMKAPFWHDEEYSREKQMEFVRKQAQKKASILFGGSGPKGLALLQQQASPVNPTGIRRRNMIRPDAKPLKERDNPFKLPKIDEKPRRPTSARKNESEEEIKQVLQRNKSADVAKKEQIALLNKIEEQTSLVYSPGRKVAGQQERPLLKAKRHYTDMLEMVYKNAGFQVQQEPDLDAMFRQDIQMPE